LQTGETATKYSNVYDLKSGDIFLFANPGSGRYVKRNLQAELAKGGHYYEVPQIRRQFTESPRPLLPTMKRVLLSQMQPIPDAEPSVTTAFARS
jgi:hypothetical protein